MTTCRAGGALPLPAIDLEVHVWRRSRRYAFALLVIPILLCFICQMALPVANALASVLTSLLGPNGPYIFMAGGIVLGLAFVVLGILKRRSW